MMGPGETWLCNEDWLAQFRSNTARLRVPLSGMLELTSRCNLRCVHCYLGSQDEQHKKRANEMSTQQVKDLIDELTAAGCLFLTITGGDPMMRPDFTELYTYARTRGLMVSIYCDGILVTDKVVETFKRYPPLVVEISLYGATAETYEQVTRVPDSFPKAIRGIERLLDAGIKVGLKTVLLSLNKHELQDMSAMADAYGVNFRFDSAVFPCLPDGDRSPVDLRVEPKEIVRQEMAHKATRTSWVEYYRKREAMPPSKELYTCGAGLTGFYIDPFSNVSPCLMTTHHRYSLAGKSFLECWEDDVPKARQRVPREDYACNSCEMRAACTGCPAFNYLENGEDDKKSDFICATTQLRHQAILDEIENEPAITEEVNA